MPAGLKPPTSSPEGELEGALPPPFGGVGGGWSWRGLHYALLTGPLPSCRNALCNCRVALQLQR